MKKTGFNELLQSALEAGAYLRADQRAVARVDRISPDSTSGLHAKLSLSQAQFARALGISIDTLQNWEQGRRQPTGAAKVLLKVAERHPEAILDAAA
ncbi:MAG TPA: helix-turn-helix domain-containing protein [Opitutaceae bacterium]|jgi:putative transcriptional regulator